MDYQHAFNLAVLALGGVLSLFISSVRNDITSLKKKHEELHTKVHAVDLLVAGNYVKREELTSAINALRTEIREGNREIKDQIEAVFEKLDNKADKPK